MSVKIYDNVQKKWVIFPGTVGAPGKDAYLIAQENGYTGTKEEYTQALVDIPNIKEDLENKINGKVDNIKEDLENKIRVTNESINEIRAVEIPNQIKASIIDNLESSSIDKSLSANQGRVLKEMITNLANIRIEIVDQLPSVGETNIIYFVKKSGSTPDIYDEYAFINENWEKIGSTGGGDVIARGDVIASGNLVSNYIIVGAGPKSVKNSRVSLESIVTNDNISKPTEFNWIAGAALGPTGSLTGNNMEPVSYPAIPSASKIESGIITTGDQEFSGHKTFDDITCEYGLIVKRHNEADYPKINLVDANFPLGTSYITPLEYTGEAASAKKVGNKLIFTGAVTGEYDGSSELSINIPAGGNGEIPIVLPNPYSLSITANNQETTYDGSIAVNLNFDSIFSKKLPILTNPDDAGKPGIFFTTDKTTTIMISARVNQEQPTAIVVVPGATTVSIEEPTVYQAQNLESLYGSVTGAYKCFCIQWIAKPLGKEDIIFINGEIYG